MSKKYSVFIRGLINVKETVTVEADNEDGALEEASMEIGVDDIYDYVVVEYIDGFTEFE